jgi:hypothetical protein
MSASRKILTAEPSVGKLLLYMGPVKRQAQYIVHNHQMLRPRTKLLCFPCVTGFHRVFRALLGWFIHRLCPKIGQAVTIGWKLNLSDVPGLEIREEGFFRSSR